MTVYATTYTRLPKLNNLFYPPLLYYICGINMPIAYTATVVDFHSLFIMIFVECGVERASYDDALLINIFTETVIYAAA